MFDVKETIKLLAKSAIDEKARQSLPYRDRAEMYAMKDGKVYGSIYPDTESFGVYGGGIDKGENPLDAAVREFKEESGWTVNNPKMLPFEPLLHEWKPPYASDKQRERAKEFRGSRTYYVIGELGEKIPRMRKDEGQRLRARLYDLDEAINLCNPSVGPSNTRRAEVLRHIKNTLNSPVKEAELLPDIKLQPHQQPLVDAVKNQGPQKILLMHALGSGKTLSGLAMAEALNQPYTAVVPAALRENLRKEQEKFTDKRLPGDVVSYSAVAKGSPEIKNLGTLIFDEAHRLRNPGSKQTINAQSLADRANQVVLLSGTPIVNEPGDLAPMVSMLTGRKMTPAEFSGRYVDEKVVRPSFLQRLRGITPGVTHSINNEDELRAMLKGHIDYYAPTSSTVPTNYEDHDVEMSKPQTQLYKAMFDKLPWVVRWKLKYDYPLSREEYIKLQSFMVGPRQVGLSTLPFLKNKDLYRAYNESSKLTHAMGLLKERLKDDRTKALIFSNFIDAGLKPYGAALEKENIPHAIFHGGLNDRQRKKLVDDYNSNKIRVALLGPSGAEGLSFKGTQLIQLLDPYWHNVRTRQQQGRGIRFDSHLDVPDELKNVLVQRFTSKLPLSSKDQLLTSLGMDREHNRIAADDILKQMSSKKDKLNHQFTELLKDIGNHKSQLGLLREDQSGYREGDNRKRDNKGILSRLYASVFGKSAEDSLITQLKQIKDLSDKHDWSSKNDKLINLMSKSPEHWVVEPLKNQTDRIVGINHWPTGFRYHMLRAAVPPAVYASMKTRKPKALIAKETPEIEQPLIPEPDKVNAVVL